MGLAPNNPKGGAKRGAGEANLDAQQEGIAAIARQGKPPNAWQSEDPEKVPSPLGGGAGPSTAPATAAATAQPSAQPQATNAPVDMKVSAIVQELNSLMLILHSRTLENQQENTSLLAEMTRLQTVYNAWVRDVLIKQHPPAMAAAAGEAGPSQQQQPGSLVNLSKSAIYPGSQPLGGVAVDSEEHIAQIENTTAMVKAEIERLKIVLEEKKKAKVQQLKERGNVTLTPELMALLQDRSTPAPTDLSQLQPAVAIKATVAQPRQEGLAPAAGGVWPPVARAAAITTQQGTNINSPDALAYLPPPAPPTYPNLQAHSVLERQIDLANLIDGFRRPQQQQQQSRHSDLVQQLLHYAGSNAAQYNNTLNNDSFAATNVQAPPIRQQQQQQQLTQQHLDLINTLEEHANIQIDPSASHQHQQHQQQPFPGHVVEAGEQKEETANFAAMLLNMIAKQQGEVGIGDMD